MTSAEETYFKLLDSCAVPMCAVCAVLRAAVVEKITADATTVRGSAHLLLGACHAHAELVTTHLRSQESSLRTLVAYLRARHAGVFAPRRWQILRPRPAEPERCMLCHLVHRREARTLGSLLAALGEMQFVRVFRTAAPLCLTHEIRLLSAADERAAECADIQQAKLAALSDRLMRHEMVQTDSAAVEAAVRYLAVDEAAPARRKGSQVEPGLEADPAPAENMDNFELAKLRREVQDLTRRLGDAESRAAALHYRVAILTTENRDWEMRYTGLASQARTLEADLRAARAHHGDDGVGQKTT
jgi:hypothetical protein